MLFNHGSFGADFVHAVVDCAPKNVDLATGALFYTLSHDNFTTLTLTTNQGLFCVGERERYDLPVKIAIAKPFNVAVEGLRPDCPIRVEAMPGRYSARFWPAQHIILSYEQLRRLYSIHV